MTSFVKIAGGIALFAVSVLEGFYFALKLKWRRDFLSAMGEMLLNLETLIRYSGEDIVSLLSRSAPESISELFVGDDSAPAFWESFVSNIPVSYGLHRSDYDLLREFGSMLGSTDLEGQLSHISQYRELFKLAENNSEKEYLSKGRLYKILGAALGSATFLLFV